MRVLGISIWMYFIWIFIVGILLYFYTVNGTSFEAFQNSDTTFMLKNGSPDQTIFTNGVTGRYIRILSSRSQGDGYINLRQVMALDANGNNFALGKPVYTTSVYPGSKPGSVVTDGSDAVGSETNTWRSATDSNIKVEFLEIDLGAPQYISSLRIMGRADCCNDTKGNDRMKGLRIQVNADSDSVDAKASYKIKYLPTSKLSIDTSKVLEYNTGGSGSETWKPLTSSTDRLRYQQKLPIGAQLFSSNRNYSLLFGTDHTLYLYNTGTPYFVLWSFYTGSDSSYIFHQGTLGINILNTGSGKGSSPFSMTAGGSWIGSMGSIDNSSYLQVLDNGDLVIYSGSGNMIFHTDTGKTAIPVCVPQSSIYAFSSSDCFQLSDSLKSLATKIVELSTKGQTVEVNAAKQMQCNFQQYYNDNSCAVIEGRTSRARDTVAEVLNKPSVSVTGRISIATNIIYTRNAADTDGVDVSSSVNPGDMIYLGYGADIQGPFVAQSVSGGQSNPSITITKNYVGTYITGAIISIKPMILGNVLTTLTEPIKMSVSNTNIVASIYPGDSYISINSYSTSSSSGSGPAPDSPANIDIGDLVYVKADNCNGTDTDNGDGTCLGYLCGIGEMDMGNGTCKKYLCDSTNIGTTLQPNRVRDTDNGDGTCTAPTVYYTDCNTNETYTPSSESGTGSAGISKAALGPGTCTPTVASSDNVVYTYSYTLTLKRESYKYNIFEGVPMDPYRKSADNGNIPYLYNKSYGPFAVAMKPSTNKILIKPFRYAKKEVFTFCPGYDYTFKEAQGICSGLGAEVASRAQLEDAWKRGADWCGCSWLNNGTSQYPINTTIFPSDYIVNGQNASGWCGGPTPGIRECFYTNGINKACVTCYGIKPPSGTQYVESFRSAYTAKNSQPASMTTTAIWNDPNLATVPVDLDSSGNFILNPTAAWRAKADLWAKYSINPQYGIPKYTWSASSAQVLGSQITPATARDKSLFETFFEAKGQCESNPSCTGITQVPKQIDPFTKKDLSYSIRTGTTLTASQAGEKTWTRSSTIGGSQPVNPYVPVTAMQDNSINLRALPKEGIVNARLYKSTYNDGIFNGTYTSLVAGSNSGNLQIMSNSIKINLLTPDLESRIKINGVNLLVGQPYSVTVVVKSTSTTNPCKIQLERYDRTTVYPTERATWGNETPGSIDQGSYGKYGNFTTIEAAKRICEATVGCAGISQNNATHMYSLRAGSTLYYAGPDKTSLINYSDTQYTSWLLNQSGGINSFNLTSEFVGYKWTFIATTSTPNFLITKTSAASEVTLEFNLLEITGGIDKSIFILGPAIPNSTINVNRVKPISEGVQCLSGYYDSDGFCNKCPAGQYSAAGATTCMSCPQGTYTDKEGSTSCIPCPAGKYSSIMGATSCADTCAAGTYGNKGGSGTVQDCQPCRQGTYNPNPGSTYCVQCPKGTYNDTTGGSSLASCKTCPQGTTTARSGTKMLALCIGCQAGSAYIGGGSTYTGGTCTPCNPGTYSPDAGAFTCLSCAEGTSSTAGATSCTKCDAGYYALSSSPQCLRCDPGYYSGKMASSCKACEPGTVSSADRTQCIPCKAGQYSPGTTDTCQTCPTNTYSPASAATCCTVGQYYSVKGKKCEPCPLDFYNDKLPPEDSTAVITKCKPCPGIYKDPTIYYGTMQNGSMQYGSTTSGSTAGGINMGQYYHGYAGITVEAPKCTSATGATAASLCVTTKCIYVPEMARSTYQGAYVHIGWNAYYKPHNGRDVNKNNNITEVYKDSDYYTYINWPTFE